MRASRSITIRALSSTGQHQVFAHQLDRLHRALGVEFVDQRGRLPVAAQQRAGGVPGPTRVMKSFCSALSMGRGSLW